MLSCQIGFAAASAAACAARSTGLASTRCRRSARRKSGARFSARSASAISVPRPGPSSARITGAGRPIFSQASAHQRPMSSPKIWLTSGAVMKSPRAPSGSRVV